MGPLLLKVTSGKGIPDFHIELGFCRTGDLGYMGERALVSSWHERRPAPDMS